MEKVTNNERIGVSLQKTPTGIKGLDEVLNGGLPQGRPSLICGGAGCGKTLMACEFLVHGVVDHNEPGVFVAFEETQEELSKNLASLGINLEQLIAEDKLFIDYVHIDRNEIEETGEYDLEGLFVRLAHAIASVGAKRVVIDTIETLFSGFSNVSILRSELIRLFRWLKNQGVTAVITAERGDGTLTRHGLEEYVSDCVILLDHRVQEGIATRRLRVIKYRGSSHGSDEYPFLIDELGIWVLPLTSVGLKYPVSREFIPTGIPQLDSLFNGKGYYRGSSILITGTAGSGKTSMAAHLVQSACRRGERCLYFAYEESSDQIVRNMSSIGIHLEEWLHKGLLRIEATRPSFYGAEMHLLNNQKLVSEFLPDVVVIDPISNFAQVGTPPEVKSLMIRLIDHFKMNHITALFTSLTSGGKAEEATDIGISSLMDTWIMLSDIPMNGERNRVLSILKSRGMAHSNHVREFHMGDRGIVIEDAYQGSAGALTGSARANQAAAEREQEDQRKRDVERKKRELKRRRQDLEAQLEELQDQYETEIEEGEIVISPHDLGDHDLLNDQEAENRSV